MITKTFHGAAYRVQFLILDLIERVSFAVSVVPSHYHKSTSFRGKAGVQVYFGQDFAAAWAKLLEFAPDAERPPAWKKWYDSKPAPERTPT